MPLAVGPAISQMRGSMLLVLTTVIPRVTANETADVDLEPLRHAGVRIGQTEDLGGVDVLAQDTYLDAEDFGAARGAVAGLLSGMRLDYCLQPVDGRRKRLLIADMDSTIINVECIDELADFAGVKAQVSEITERAMRGELDFEAALREREIGRAHV